MTTELIPVEIKKPVTKKLLTPKKTKSEGLSKRIKQFVNDGRRLNEDSKPSEKNLNEAIDRTLVYLNEEYHNLGAVFRKQKIITLYDCEKYYHAKWTDHAPEPNPEHKRYYMTPDGGMIVMTLNGKETPILISEDKRQGTNDQGTKKSKQSTGNAIERSAKNIRGAEMIFAELNVFPYVLFCNGCDFHHTETIPGRLLMMNYGRPFHYVEITPDTNEEMVDEKIDMILDEISIEKQPNGKDAVSCFVKGHKWNECAKGASMWTVNQRVKILKKVVDIVLKSVLHL